MQVRHCLGQYGNDVVHLGVQTHYDPSQLFALLLVALVCSVVVECEWSSVVVVVVSR